MSQSKTIAPEPPVPVGEVAPDDQRPTLAFLERPQSYGAQADPIVRIDTHVSSIFLTRSRAYKLKRAVRFSYLDFSTVALREASARAELRLNARTAPDLYLAVRAIVRAEDGSLAFDGRGDTIDWVVEMLRFDDGALFDHMLAGGTLDDALARELGREIARFHDSAERTPEFGGRASIEEEIAGNERNLALASPDLRCPSGGSELVRSWRRELAAYGTLLDRRNVAGKTRRCHGDLHLRNIALWHDRPTLFDCIEFNEHLSCIDVLYDLAFLLMDLRHRDHGAKANLIFNTYFDRNDESDGIVLLPLFISLRAAIRAHTGVAGANAQSDPERRAAGLEEARSYLALAERSMHGARPQLIAIGGLSGSGKTTLALALGSELGRAPGARSIHTDAMRKRIFGVAPTARLEADAYAPETSARVYRAQLETAAALLRDGCATIVDGVYARRDDRDAVAELARSARVPFVGLWLVAPDDALRSRVSARRGDMSDATVAIVESQLHTRTSDIEWIRVDAGGSAAMTLERARAALARASDDLRVGTVPS